MQVQTSNAAGVFQSDFRATASSRKAEELLGLVRADDLRVALDELMAFARREAQTGRPRRLNQALDALADSVDESLEFAIGVLTATLPVKSRLSHRPRYVEEVKRALRALGKNPEVVLKGLL